MNHMQVPVSSTVILTARDPTSAPAFWSEMMSSGQRSKASAPWKAGLNQNGVPKQHQTLSPLVAVFQVNSPVASPSFATGCQGAPGSHLSAMVGLTTYCIRLYRIYTDSCRMALIHCVEHTDTASNISDITVLFPLRYEIKTWFTKVCRLCSEAVSPSLTEKLHFLQTSFIIQSQRQRLSASTCSIGSMFGSFLLWDSFRFSGFLDFHSHHSGLTVPLRLQDGFIFINSFNLMKQSFDEQSASSFRRHHVNGVNVTWLPPPTPVLRLGQFYSDWLASLFLITVEWGWSPSRQSLGERREYSLDSSYTCHIHLSLTRSHT